MGDSIRIDSLHLAHGYVDQRGPLRVSHQEGRSLGHLQRREGCAFRESPDGIGLFVLVPPSRSAVQQHFRHLLFSVVSNSNSSSSQLFLFAFLSDKVGISNLLPFFQPLYFHVLFLKSRVGFCVFPVSLALFSLLPPPPPAPVCARRKEKTERRHETHSKLKKYTTVAKFMKPVVILC